MTKYSDNKRKGNIGEAFVQVILSSFCLVHKIDGSQDIGYDLICELTKGEYPSNILFYVQVKFWETEPKDSDLKKQLDYWEASPIPVYLFWIDAKESIPFEIINDLKSQDKISQLKYKRYTPITHGNEEPQILKFKEFSKSVFLRDLMVDYARCLYKKGMATVIKKRDFTEIDEENIPLGNNCLFVSDVIPNYYRSEFIENSWTNLISAAKAICIEYKNDVEKLKLALEHAELAQKMISFSDQEFHGFCTPILNIIEEIKSLVSR